MCACFITLLAAPNLYLMLYTSGAYAHAAETTVIAFSGDGMVTYDTLCKSATRLF